MERGRAIGLGAVAIRFRLEQCLHCCCVATLHGIDKRCIRDKAGVNGQ
jgi:hypothetical protein